MAAPIYLPAHMVVTRGVLPDVCPRHARLAARQRKMTFSSPPPLWVYLFLFLGVLPLLIAYLIVRKTLVAPSWSFCDLCLARRKKLGVTAVGVLAAIVAAGFVGDSVFGLGLLVGAPTLLVLLSLRSWGVLAAADVTREGHALRLRKPDPDYVDHLPQSPSAGPVVPQYGTTTAPRTF